MFTKKFTLRTKHTLSSSWGTASDSRIFLYTASFPTHTPCSNVAGLGWWLTWRRPTTLRRNYSHLNLLIAGFARIMSPPSGNSICAIPSFILPRQLSAITGLFSARCSWKASAATAVIKSIGHITNQLNGKLSLTQNIILSTNRVWACYLFIYWNKHQSNVTQTNILCRWWFRLPPSLFRLTLNPITPSSWPPD